MTTHGPNGKDEPTFYRVSNREVYERIGTLEAKIDDGLRQLSIMESHIVDHHKRIRALELRFYGVLAGLVGALAVLIKIGVGG